MEEHSFQINGQGAAFITDMTVECVPNHDRSEISEHSDSEEKSDDDDQDEIWYGHEYEPDEAVKTMDREIGTLNREVAAAKEEIHSAAVRSAFLDDYGKSMTSEDRSPESMFQYLQLYGDERKKMFQIHQSCESKVAPLEREIEMKSRERRRLARAGEQAAEKARREKMKTAQKKKQARDDKLAEKRRLKEQLLAFWPKKVYKVVLSLEASPDDISSVGPPEMGDLQKKMDGESSSSPAQSLPISLSFSYVTRAASWYPAYNVQLATPSRSGTISYRAEFQNATSETWRNAKMSLSTSQASFSGLFDAIPTMVPWHIRLAKRDSVTSRASQAFGSLASKGSVDGGLESFRERDEKRKLKGGLDNSNRSDLFGRGPDAASNAFANHNFHYQSSSNTGFGGLNVPGGHSQGLFGGAGAPRAPAPLTQQQNLHQQHYQMALLQQQQRQQSQQQQMQQHHLPQPPAVAAVGAAPRARVGGGVFGQVEAEIGAEDQHHQSGMPDDASVVSADTMAGTLAFQESSREDHGLTTTYSLPGLRTLGPSHLKRRHLITNLSLTSISLSYILIPKLRQAAFLKARIRNTSPVTLLRGRASLTLDGTFLGNTNIPRASPDETFTLLLGIDPAIHVAYAKPTVRRSSSGMFNKEESVVYSRVITITNTKLQKEAVELVVLDQMPVSEDEQLRMSISQPAGLKHEGDKVKTGQGIQGGTTGQGIQGGTTGWGKAVATLKKDGEVMWNVTLNRGGGCRLTLEYEARIPASEVLEGID